MADHEARSGRVKAPVTWLFRREFTAQAPDQAWVSCFTYLRR